jgi:ankyrin repeat protein
MKLVCDNPQLIPACVCTMSELHQAVLKSDLDVVKLLLGQTNLEVNARDLSGALAFTPLHLAARRGDVKVLRCLLLDSRVDIEARDATKCTALRHAMGTGQLAAASKYMHQHSQSIQSFDAAAVAPAAADPCRSVVSAFKATPCHCRDMQIVCTCHARALLAS